MPKTRLDSVTGRDRKLRREVLRDARQDNEEMVRELHVFKSDAPPTYKVIREFCSSVRTAPRQCLVSGRRIETLSQVP